MESYRENISLLSLPSLPGWPGPDLALYALQRLPHGWLVRAPTPDNPYQRGATVVAVIEDHVPMRSEFSSYVRTAALLDAHYRCERCGERSGLEPHHRGNPQDHSQFNCEVLCLQCHAAEHRRRREKRAAYGRLYISSYGSFWLYGWSQVARACIIRGYYLAISMRSTTNEVSPWV